MSFDGEEKQWGCGNVGSANLQIVSSIVRDIGEPLLNQSPIKVCKMLKPEKWQATYDSDGKFFGFQKALRLIVLGGVDPSIRPEVWEFLLGCYTLGSTADYRRKLRTARRERYKDLIKQCKMMHSSVGTGSLAFVVGSKVMDMRMLCTDEGLEIEGGSKKASNNNSNNMEYSNRNNNCTDTSACETESPSYAVDLSSVRENTDSAVYESCCHVHSSAPCSSPKLSRSSHASQHILEPEPYFDFSGLPVTDLFEKSGDENKEHVANGNKRSAQRKLRYSGDIMHSFQIEDNVDLVVESSTSLFNNSTIAITSEIEMTHPTVPRPFEPDNQEFRTEIINRLRISDVRETPGINASEDRVSEWLWTLHRIAVDVVRTDCHLEFFEDKKNLARMSDILAVYAWVDPATGYCQGMSDLLSPFVVLFEDNADAFWCFEMLLRRMRENFLVEGPTGVLKQLQALWHILEFTDREMFAHFARIGAESLHFAFPMLLVLFRRELTFDEALSMWELNRTRLNASEWILLPYYFQEIRHNLLFMLLMLYWKHTSRWNPPAAVWEQPLKKDRGSLCAVTHI